MMTEKQRDAVAVLAHLYLQNGKTEKALRLLEALHSLFPNYGQTTALLAWALHASGDYSRAIQMVDLASRQQLEHDKLRAIFLLKSEALWRLGRKEEARRALVDYEREAHQPTS